jgi:hypothetical protein
MKAVNRIGTDNPVHLTWTGRAVDYLDDSLGSQRHHKEPP